MNTKRRLLLSIIGVMLLSIVILASPVAASSKVKKNGYYETSVSKKALALMDPYGTIYGYNPYIKKFSLKNNKLTTYGNYYYAKTEKILLSYFGIKKIGAKKRVFTLSKKCKFYTGGGGTPSSLNNLRVTKISKTAAKKILKSYDKHDVIIHVKKGQSDRNNLCFIM